MTMEENVFSNLKQKIIKNKIVMIITLALAALVEKNVFSNLKQKINKNKIFIIITLALSALVLLTLLYL